MYLKSSGSGRSAKEKGCTDRVDNAHVALGYGSLVLLALKLLPDLYLTFSYGAKSLLGFHFTYNDGQGLVVSSLFLSK